MSMELKEVGHETVLVDQFVDGILDPNRPMLGPVRDGGHIVANTVPGCWGPMITPEIRGGHEVTHPVAVAGAEVGDAIAIRIKDITVTSLATASGNDKWMEGPDCLVITSEERGHPSLPLTRCCFLDSEGLSS